MSSPDVSTYDRAVTAYQGYLRQNTFALVVAFRCIKTPYIPKLIIYVRGLRTSADNRRVRIHVLRNRCTPVDQLMLTRTCV